MGLIDVAVKKEGFAYFDKPKVMLLFHDNKFERNNAQKQTEKALLNSLELYVNVNYRWDSSAILADIVLPSITNYEGWELRADPGYSRFANVMMPPEGLKIPGKPNLNGRYACSFQRRFRRYQKKGIGSIEDKQFKTTRDMDKIYDDFITVGNSRITGEKELLEWALSASSASIGSADMKSLKNRFCEARGCCWTDKPIVS